MSLLFSANKERRKSEILGRKKSKNSTEFAGVIYSRTLAAIYDFFYVFSFFKTTIKEEEEYYQGRAWNDLSEEQKGVLLEKIEEVESILEEMKEKISFSKK